MRLLHFQRGAAHAEILIVDVMKTIGWLAFLIEGSEVAAGCNRTGAGTPGEGWLMWPQRAPHRGPALQDTMSARR